MTPSATVQPVVGRVPVHLRHIRPSLAGEASVTVLGIAFTAVRDGINGEHGFTGGGCELRLGEEGQATLKFPNTTSVGGLHRERFEILKKGKVTPLGGSMYQYEGGSYRPGDEWLEVWEGHAPHGDLMFVGTPTQATVTPQEVTLELRDGYFLTRKTRTTAADFWSHAPRDVFEHCTRVWTPLWADDFENRAIPYNTNSQPGGPGYDGAGNWLTPDGAYYVSFMRNDPNRPGAVYMQPVGQGATLKVAKQVTIGRSVDAHVRGEATLNIKQALGQTGHVIAGFYNNSYGYDVYMMVHAEYSSGSPRTVMVLASENSFNGRYQVQVRRAEALPPTPGVWKLAVEVRGRWTFCYLNGALMGVVPTPETSFSGRFSVGFGPGTYMGRAEAAVESILVREAKPLLMRSLLAKGDYRLPGEPSSAGLLGSYYNQSQMLAGNHRDRLFDPITTPVARRVDPVPLLWNTFNGANGIQGSPPGVLTQGVYVKWTGSIYLDLDNYDYRLVTMSGDRVRVWVGKTRYGEQVIEDWPWNGHAPTLMTGNWLKGGVALGGVTGPLYGQPSGWYPIVVEGGKDPANGAGALAIYYNRSDSQYVNVPLGAPEVYHTIAKRSSLRHLYTFADATQGWALDHVPTNKKPFLMSNSGWDYPKPVIGSVTVPDFMNAGVGAYLVEGSPAEALSTAGWWLGFTLEFVVDIETTSGTQTIVRREGSLIVRIHGGQWQLYVYNAGSGGFILMTNPATVTVGRHHVAVSVVQNAWDFWVDGVRTQVSGPLHEDSASAMYIGSFNGTGEFWTGRIALMAHYTRAITPAEVAESIAQLDGPVSVRCSPMGIHNQAHRYESHYDVIQTLKDTFGLQFTVEPRSLESGAFPGEMVPRARVGRDTAKRLDTNEAIGNMQVQVDATAVCDALLADGAGAGDQQNAASLVVEAIDYSQIGKHMLVHQEFESLAEISFMDLLEQRVRSLLALRGAPWEEVSAQPRGVAELMDKWPLTGALALFNWKPGDGVSLDLPEIGVVDQYPRQILGVSRAFVPDGVGVPTVSFRQRPRSTREVLRKMLRTTLQEKRNYQGGFVTLYGTRGGEGGTDLYSRLSLAGINLSRVESAEVVISNKSDGSAWSLSVNNSLVVSGITATGRFNVLPWLTRYPGDERVFSHMTGGTGAAGHHLEVVVAEDVSAR